MPFDARKAAREPAGVASPGLGEADPQRSFQELVSIGVQFPVVSNGLQWLSWISTGFHWSLMLATLVLLVSVLRCPFFLPCVQPEMRCIWFLRLAVLSKELDLQKISKTYETFEHSHTHTDR